MDGQDRIIKKMIDNIVEKNKPEFEKPFEAQTTSGATTNQAPSTEDNSLLMRKVEYGFNNLRQENAEIRKTLDELKGTINLMRNDLDSIRMAVQQQARGTQPSSERHIQQASPSSSSGAPQYRKSEADEAYEHEQGSGDSMPKVQQARGFQKKDPANDIDISKVFYYGKK